MFGLMVNEGLCLVVCIFGVCDVYGKCMTVEYTSVVLDQI